MALFPMFIGGIGPLEMSVVFLLVILLFGANKLPALARSSGQAMGEFKRGREQIEQELAAARDDVTTAAMGDDEAVENVDAEAAAAAR